MEDEMYEQGSSFKAAGPPPRRRPRARMRGIVLGLAFGVAAFSAVASAAWTAQTTGNHGYGKFGSLQGVTTVQAVTTADCFPSSTCTLSFKFSNPNAQAVSVSGVTTAGYGVTGCTSPDATLAASYTFTLVVPPGVGTATKDIANGVTIGASPSNDCQGAEIDFSGLTVSTTT